LNHSVREGQIFFVAKAKLEFLLLSHTVFVIFNDNQVENVLLPVQTLREIGSHRL